MGEGYQGGSHDNDITVPNVRRQIAELRGRFPEGLTIVRRNGEATTGWQVSDSRDKAGHLEDGRYIEERLAPDRILVIGPNGLSKDLTYEQILGMQPAEVAPNTEELSAVRVLEGVPDDLPLTGAGLNETSGEPPQAQQEDFGRVAADAAQRLMTVSPVSTEADPATELPVTETEVIEATGEDSLAAEEQVLGDNHEEAAKSPAEIIKEAMSSPEEFERIYKDSETPHEIKLQMRRLIEAWRESLAVDSLDALWQEKVVPELKLVAESNLPEIANGISNIVSDLENVRQALELTARLLREGGTTALAGNMGQVRAKMGGGAAEVADRIKRAVAGLNPSFDDARAQAFKANSLNDDSVAQLRRQLSDVSGPLQPGDAQGMFLAMSSAGAEDYADALSRFRDRADSNRSRTRRDSIEMIGTFSGRVSLMLNDTERFRAVLRVAHDMEIFSDMARRSRFDIEAIGDMVQRIGAIKRDIEPIERFARNYSREQITELIERGSATGQ